MKKLVFFILVLSLVTALPSEDEVNLELGQNGLTLPQASGGRFFLPRRTFPSATTTSFKTIDGQEQTPFLESTDINGQPDGQFKLVGVLGQLSVQTSKAAPHFRVKSGSLTTSIRSVHKIRAIQRIRTPVDLSTD